MQDKELTEHLALLHTTAEGNLGQLEVLFACVAAMLRTVDPTGPAAAHMRASIQECLALLRDPDSATPAAALTAGASTAARLLEALQPQAPVQAH